MPTKRPIAYTYAGIFLFVILIILVVNGLFLLNRTGANLVEIYWKQAEVVIESIALSGRNSIKATHLKPEELRESLLPLVRQAGKISPDSPQANQELARLAELNQFELLLLVGEQGILAHSYEGEHEVLLQQLEDRALIFQPQGRDWQLWVVPGQAGTEWLQIRIGLQTMVDSLKERNVIRYLSFVNQRHMVVADSDHFRLGEVDQNSTLEEAIRHGATYFDQKLDVMEAIHPLTYLGERKGAFKIGLPITEIARIMGNTEKNAILFSVGLLLVAMVGTGLGLKVQFAYSQKMEQVQKQIRENEKLLSLGNLAAGVAHEVRNPLNSIGITIQRLQLEFEPKEDEEEFFAFTNSMQKEVARINQIITDFLGFSKPYEPRFNDFKIGNFFDNLLILFQADAAEKGVEIVQRIENGQRFYYGDHDKLHQVVLNLLKNALEATPAGQNIFIDSQTNKTGDWVIKIQDEGTGISPEQLSQIFDIYFTTKEHGTGLGLYICRKIIRAHHGTIEIYNNPGPGMTAEVSLPKLEY